jgi:hypothetical protein
MNAPNRISLLAKANLAVAAVVALAFTEGAARAGDPTTADCLSASDASLKFGNQHKLRAERAQLLLCAASTCPADIRKECLSRVDEVNAQMPTIVFSARDASGADLSAVKVTLDGEVLAEHLEGSALAVDPGEHTLTFETAGHPDVTKKLMIIEGEKERRELITFGAPSGVSPPEGGAGQSAQGAPEGGAAGQGGLGTQKVLALVAGGLGVVGVGVGAVFGVMAMSKKSDAQNSCPGPGTACATQNGVSKWSDAASAGNVSTIGFIVGGVGLAAAGVLWFTATAPSASAATAAQVGLGPGGIQVKGTW